MTTIAIVGATGNAGRELVRLLLARGVAVRALGRNADKLAALAACGAEPRAADLHDAKSLAEAFRGVDGLCAMIPTTPDHGDPRADQRQIADAIAAGLQVARVRHAVTLSSIGADQPGATGPIAGLRGLEERFNQVPGLAVVHLRAGFFYENLLASIPLIKAMAVNGGLIRPEVEMAMVASRDVAAAGAEVLSDLTFTGQRTRELQGPRDYTMAEVTRIILAPAFQE